MRRSSRVLLLATLLLSCGYCVKGQQKKLSSPNDDSTAKTPPPGSARLATKVGWDMSMDRIVGGYTSEKGRFPYVVALYTGQGRQVCAGALIAPNWVLTAAHCSVMVEKAKVNLHNKQQGTAEDPNIEEFNIIQKVNHPEYGMVTRAGNAYDVALFKLSGNSSVPPVALNRWSHIPTNDQAVTVVGWGALCEIDPLTGKECPSSLTLRQVDLKYMPNSECRSFYGETRVSDDMMCAGVDEGGKDACQGDSGGPLILRGGTGNAAQDVVLGVVSWGKGCARQGSPGVYCRVSYILKWAAERVCNDGVADLCQLAQSLNNPQGISSASSSTTTTTSTKPPPVNDLSWLFDNDTMDKEEEVEDADWWSSLQLFPNNEDAYVAFDQCQRIQQQQSSCSNMKFKGRSLMRRECDWVAEWPGTRCKVFNWCCPETCGFTGCNASSRKANGNLRRVR